MGLILCIVQWIFTIDSHWPMDYFRAIKFKCNFIRYGYILQKHWSMDLQKKNLFILEWLRLFLPYIYNNHESTIKKNYGKKNEARLNDLSPLRRSVITWSVWFFVPHFYLILEQTAKKNTQNLRQIAKVSLIECH